MGIFDFLKKKEENGPDLSNNWRHFSHARKEKRKIIACSLKDKNYEHLVGKTVEVCRHGSMGFYTEDETFICLYDTREA